MNLYYLYGSKYLKKTNCLNLAPIEAISSQRSGEIKAKAGQLPLMKMEFLLQIHKLFILHELAVL